MDRVIAARGLRIGDVAEHPQTGHWGQVAELHLYLARVDLVTIGGGRWSLALDELVVLHHRTVEIEA